MEKEKSPRAVAAIQLFNSTHHHAQRRRVSLFFLPHSVTKIREETEQNVAFLVRQIPDLELINLRLDRRRVTQENGHDDERPGLVRYADSHEVQLWQRAWWKESSNEVIHHFHGNLTGRKHEKQDDNRVESEHRAADA